MFKCNCVVNEVEDILTENIALGETKGKGRFYYNVSNSGGSVVNYEKSEDANIEIQTLDEYILDNHIAKDEIDCIWLDTEGCEAEILLGAAERLKSKRIPLMQEYNPFTYIKRGKESAYYEMMKMCYTYFIDIEEPQKKYNIDLLPEYKNVMKEANKKQADLFFF